MSGEESKVHVRVLDINPHLLCVLCGGYLIDATTIIECLHSFCRTCISRYLDTSKFCPICDVMVHKTKPLQYVRSDKTLQTLVYKLIPGLYQRELSRRKAFYSSQPDAGKSDAGEWSVDPDLGVCCESEWSVPLSSPSDDPISLCLQHCQRLPIKTRGRSKKADRRFLLCPPALTVGHLKKFLTLKFNLPTHYHISIFHSNESLANSYSLNDIARVYSWKRRKPLKLYYTIWNGELLSDHVVNSSIRRVVNTSLTSEENMGLSQDAVEISQERDRISQENAQVGQKVGNENGLQDRKSVGCVGQAKGHVGGFGEDKSGVGEGMVVCGEGKSVDGKNLTDQDGVMVKKKKKKKKKKKSFKETPDGKESSKKRSKLDKARHKLKKKKSQERLTDGMRDEDRGRKRRRSNGDDDLPRKKRKKKKGSKKSRKRDSSLENPHGAEVAKGESTEVKEEVRVERQEEKLKVREHGVSETIQEKSDGTESTETKAENVEKLEKPCVTKVEEKSSSKIDSGEREISKSVADETIGCSAEKIPEEAELGKETSNNGRTEEKRMETSHGDETGMKSLEEGKENLVVNADQLVNGAKCLVNGLKSDPPTTLDGKMEKIAKGWKDMKRKDKPNGKMAALRKDVRKSKDSVEEKSMEDSGVSVEDSAVVDCINGSDSSIPLTNQESRSDKVLESSEISMSDDTELPEKTEHAKRGCLNNHQGVITSECVVRVGKLTEKSACVALSEIKDCESQKNTKGKRQKNERYSLKMVQRRSSRNNPCSRSPHFRVSPKKTSPVQNLSKVAQLKAKLNRLKKSLQINDLKRSPVVVPRRRVIILRPRKLRS